MIEEKTKLNPFTLKLSPADKKKIKLICATDSNFKYQYEVFDAAVRWASDNKELVYAVANPKNGSNSSYYLSDTVDLLKHLELHWDCNSTRALYTAIVHFLRSRKISI